MLNFSQKTQSFYDLNIDYSELPSDLVEITEEQHTGLLQKLNEGCHVFADLTYSEPRPTHFHIWSRGQWVDKRTSTEKRADYLNTLRPLTRRQFKLALLENNLLEKVESTIENIPDLSLRKRFQIEYTESDEFQRQSESVIAMCNLLELKDEEVDILWQQAMTL
ncbi:MULTISPECIES: hypothetical protein [Acinetobacter]|uniref:hypothetical protein n=1 Tax=Acinetobacter TaxID=469 RepID=UPI000CFEE17D|nr:hypothetical protein [Acinetobacter sp. MYb10]QLD60631.1 hypothetical protein CQZ96_004810 [Acinetobacter sp. MYb10]